MFTLVATVGVALVSSVALHSVAAPASRPPASEPTSPPEPRNKPPKIRQTEEVHFTDGERQKFEEFMKANSPKKWETFQQMLARAPDRPRTRQLQQGLASRYRELENIRTADAQRHQFEVEAIRIEDKAYGILQNLRIGREPDQNEKLLRSLAADFVDNRHAWREIRIQRVRAELNSLGLKKVVAAMKEETEREDKKKTREEQIHLLVQKWKQGANQPKLKGPLPGGDRPPIDPGPATEPASTPAA